MSPSDLRAAVLAAGGSVDDLTSGPDWQMCATLPRERLRLLADAARIAWAYEEDFDRWANSRDAVTPLPRDAEQFALAGLCTGLVYTVTIAEIVRDWRRK